MKKLVLIGLLSLSMTFKVFAMARGGSAPSSPSGLDKDLMSAAVAGNAERVKDLIEQRANVDVQSRAGATPLCAAASQGHFNIVKMLLGSGAKFNVHDSSGKKAFEIASQKANDKSLDPYLRTKYELIRKILILQKEVFTQNELNFFLVGCIAQANKNDIDDIARLLDLGADINAIHEQDCAHDEQNCGHTALMLAILSNNREIAKFLITRGADVNTKNFDKQTALMMATAQEDKELVELLIQAGAEVNDQDNLKETALILATDKGNLPIARLLMDARADVNAATHHGATPLMFATRINNKKHAAVIIEELIESKANIDEVDSKGLTPLIHAVYGGNYKAVVCLLDAFADTDKQDENGICALFVAAKNGHTGMVQRLLKARADYLLLDKDKLNLLDCAKVSKKPDLIEMVEHLPVDIMCVNANKPFFVSLQLAAKTLSDPRKVLIHPADGCEVVSFKTIADSHVRWCTTNPFMKRPISSHRWSSILDSCSSKNAATRQKPFSLGMQDFGVAPLTEISDLVASSATEPKP